MVLENEKIYNLEMIYYITAIRIVTGVSSDCGNRRYMMSVINDAI